MDSKVKRIGYLPRRRVLEIIDEKSKSEAISRTKVVGILVARGIQNFGYGYLNKSKQFKSDNYSEIQRDNESFTETEDEFVDDSGYTVSSHKSLD